MYIMGDMIKVAKVSVCCIAAFLIGFCGTMLYIASHYVY